MKQWEVLREKSAGMGWMKLLVKVKGGVWAILKGR